MDATQMIVVVLTCTILIVILLLGIWIGLQVSRDYKDNFPDDSWEGDWKDNDNQQ